MCTYNQLKSSYTLTFGASVDYVLMRSIFTDKIEYNLVHDRFIQFFIIHSVQDISSRNRGIINRSLLSSFSYRVFLYYSFVLCFADFVFETT